MKVAVCREVTSVAVDCPRWYVIYARPRYEDRAAKNLQAWGIETFNPKFRERRFRTVGSSRLVVQPLFPRYLFARFEATNMLHKVSFTRGVSSVLSFGNGPAPVDDRIVALIRSRIMKDGFIELSGKLELGDSVVIESGPFRNLAGIFEQEIRGSDRVRILLNAISYQGKLVIDRSQIRKVG